MRILMLSLLLVAGGCKKKPPEEPPQPEAPAPVEAEPKTEAEAMQQMKANFERVFFEFDSTDLAGDSRAALNQNAEIMQKFPNIRVEVQGHADERGTTEYNLALGQKRAQGIVDQLASQGIARSRLSIVSYGEEKPLAQGSTESAWSRNRRAEFRIIGSAPEDVQGTTPG